MGFANSQDFTFAPLRGERDKQWEASLIIPYRGWNLEVDNYQTRATNWLDHNNIGNSNLFWPITWYAALIQGWDLTLRSPMLWHRLQAHLVYANQIAQATSPINGGLICPDPNDQNCPLYMPPGFSPVDHDQTKHIERRASTASLPWHSFASGNVYYGSGFINGLYGTPESQYPGPYLPGHTTVDLSLGKSFSEGKYAVSVTALNVANLRVQWTTVSPSADFTGTSLGKFMESFVGGSTTDSSPHSTIEPCIPVRATTVGKGHSKPENRVRYLIVLFAISAIVVSSLALKVHYDDPGKEPCSINDKWDCGVVNHSPYAMIHGVPVAAIGIAGYLLIAILAFLRRRALLLILVLIGLGFALHLTSIEAHVLEVWCLYCVISQGIIAILTVLSLIWLAWPKLRPSSA